MNKHRHPKLPSISTLLTLPSPPSPPQIVVDDPEPPSFSLSPASPRPSAFSSSSNKGVRSPYLSVALSPILSPIDSPGSSSRRSPSPLPSPSLLSPNINSNFNSINNSNNNNTSHNNVSLPPLQGDDPPRKLQRHPSISSISSITTSPKPQYNSVWTSSSPFMTSPHQSTMESPVPSSLPSPTIPDAASTCTNMTRSVSPCSSMGEDGPISLQQSHQERDNSSSLSSNSSHSDPNEKPPLPPAMQIVLSESGQPILKRRRGRPPSMREPTLEGGWTFLTPTVWDVNNPQSQQQQQQQEQQQQNDHSDTPDSVMNGSMAAFTSSNMDMVLQMPRKKRGRKPKTHIAGNSCFVWKEITASRRTKKSKTKPPTTLRRLEQAPSESSIA